AARSEHPQRLGDRRTPLRFRLLVQEEKKQRAVVARRLNIEPRAVAVDQADRCVARQLALQVVELDGENIHDIDAAAVDLSFAELSRQISIDARDLQRSALQ